MSSISSSNCFLKFSSKKNLEINKLFKFLLINSILFGSSIVNAAHDHREHMDSTYRFSGVGTGPYFGLGESYLGTDLVVLQPSINTDLALLKENQTMAENTGVKDGPDIPYVQMSGFTEVQGIFETNSKNAISLSAAQLTFDAWVNPWLTAFSSLGIELDETANNNFRMVTAFVTAGNLNKSPFYATIGQIFAPFGSFSTGTSDMGTLTRSVGRIYQKALNVGFYPNNGFHAAASFYNGKTRNSKTNNVDQFAGTVSYTGKGSILETPASFKAGVSYTNNMADVAGMRNIFNQGAVLNKFVAAGDVFAKLNVGPVILRSEYVSALEKFSEKDILQNNAKIKPSSYSGEVEYDTYVYGKEAWFVLHYSEVTDAAAMTRTHYQRGINGSVNILKNTIVSLEYSNRKSYADNNQISNSFINTPGVAGTNTLNPAALAAVNAGLNGRTRNKIVATLDLFF